MKREGDRFSANELFYFIDIDYCRRAFDKNLAALRKHTTISCKTNIIRNNNGVEKLRFVYWYDSTCDLQITPIVHVEKKME